VSTIIRRTNPNRKMGMGGVVFECSACGSKFDTFELGSACAVADFAKRDKEAAAAVRRARRAARAAA
jgi:hypothetical protein